jgi:DNA-binding NarL/FixJ family response regulator
MAKVLLVEDEPLLALAVADALVEAGYEVCGVAESAAAAIALAVEHRPELAIVDVRLAGNRDGIDTAEELMRLQPIRVLYATANCSDVRRRAKVGEGCLSKPYRVEWLIAALKIVEGGASDRVVSVPPGFSFVRS